MAGRQGRRKDRGNEIPVKWVTSAFFISAVVWALFAFTGCALVKECRHTGWEMPNGVVCERKMVVEINQQVYFECADGWEYRNPPKVKHVEECE